MSDETTLLPCPFCGGEADEYEGDYGNGIYCMMCGAMVGEPIHLEYMTTKRVSIDEAIAAWNVRAPVEHDGWFYLPKPKESIVQYGEQRTEKTEHGYKVTQPVEVIEGAIRSWGDELGEYVMRRICETWDTRHVETCHPVEVPLGIHDDATATVCSACRVAIDDLADCYYCPNCGRKVVDA